MRAARHATLLGTGARGLAGVATSSAPWSAAFTSHALATSAKSCVPAPSRAACLAVRARAKQSHVPGYVPTSG